MITGDLAHVLETTTALLLDFDGPVTPLFEDGRASAIAVRMRQILRELGVVDLPPPVGSTDDPLAVLSFTYERDSAALTRRVEDILIAGELAAAAAALPNPGGHETLAACHETGLPVVIVSNNSPACVEACVERHRLDQLVLATIGRAYVRPDLMKPHPAPVELASCPDGHRNPAFWLAILPLA